MQEGHFGEYPRGRKSGGEAFQRTRNRGSWGGKGHPGIRMRGLEVGTGAEGTAVREPGPHPFHLCRTRPGDAGWTWKGRGGPGWLSALPPTTSAGGGGWGQEPHQTTGKRMAPQQMRSTRKRISFQSM